MGARKSGQRRYVSSRVSDRALLQVSNGPEGPGPPREKSALSRLPSLNVRPEVSIDCPQGFIGSGFDGFSRGAFYFGKGALFFPLDEAERVPEPAPGANKSLKNYVACVKLAIYQVLTRLELAGRKQ